VGSASVLWAETPDADRDDDAPEAEAHGELDESFAARRLRRWLKGMFGGRAETDSGEPDGSPDES
jgi:hypothetical protein